MHIYIYTGNSIRLDINNDSHHEMIQQLSKDLDQDGIDHRKLYRYLKLTKKQKAIVEDSKTSKTYESLAQYVEKENPTIAALVKCLRNCEVKDAYIHFIISYEYL